jgi:shikimate kinase
LPDLSQLSQAKAGLPPESRIVCLSGFMGSGKSTVGRLLAARLAWNFVDLDAEIEQHAGLTVSQIFEQKGEAVFRDIEHECLARVLGRVSERRARVVLALGGGTIAQPRNVALLRGAALAQHASVFILWLDCPMEELLKRCVLMGDRPLFRDEASFRKLYQERLPFYRQADWRIESGAEPARVVELILALNFFDRSTRARTDESPPGPACR